jgi:tetratricopeptide (TPR) repeat protein
VRRIRTVVVCYLILIALNGVAVSQQPSEFESLLASAQQAQARGDFEAAADFYRKAVGLQPKIAELRANLGLMYYQTGKDQQAIASFLEAIRLKPDLFVPNLFLGLDYLKVKRFNEAIPYLKRAALSRPTDVQAQVALGQAYAAAGKTRLAIAYYLGSAQADSGNADGWFRLGVAYLEQVEADARVLLARHKDSGYLHALVADTFAEQGAYIQAAEAYKTTLATEAFPSGTHAAYGFVLLSQHDLPGAERELNAEVASNPGSQMAKLGLARLKVEQGDPRKGANEIAEIWKANASFLRANASMFNRGLSTSRSSELQRTLEEGTATGEVPKAVVSLFRNKGTSRDITDLPQPSSNAVEITRRSSRQSASEAATYKECNDLLPVRSQQLRAKDLRLLVSCAYSTAKYQTGFETAQKLALSPSTEAEGLYWETRSGQKLATEALARASAINSNSPTLHVLLGDIYRQRKYYPDAEQEYRKALAIQPEDAGALFGLSLAVLADSDLDEALRLAEGVLKKSPDDPEFNAVMGEILSAQHDFSGAEPYLKKALNTKPELIPHVHALLGRVYAETNRTQQAIAEMTLGLSDDKDGRLHYQIARLYLKIGDRNSARKAFEVSHRLRSEGLTRAAVAMQQGENDTESQ